MSEQNALFAAFGGGCLFQDCILCVPKSAACETCGFNPDNGVHERRIEKAMREYRRKVNAGEVFPVY